MSVSTPLAKAAAAVLTWGLRNVLGREAGNFPGKVALRIDPSIIHNLKDKAEHSVVIVGTNGKTTVTNLIADLLEQSGKTVVCNRSGANLAYGVASALLHAPASNDWAVLESDELWLARTLPQLQADYVVLLNLFRDQLDRCGEIDRVQEAIVNALNESPNTVLLYNGDDPQCERVARQVGNPKMAFGIEEDLGLKQNSVTDAHMCQICSGMLSYSRKTYGQLGVYRCQECGFERPSIDYSLVQVRLGEETSSFTLQGREATWNMTMPFGGAYMVYNVGAVCAFAQTIGCTQQHAQEAINRFAPANGRLQRLHVGDIEVLLNLAKNPTGFNQNLRLVNQGEKAEHAAVAFFINDKEADGHDISWLWDIDFEELCANKDLTAFAGGIRANDMQLRLKYAGINAAIVSGATDVVAWAKANGVAKVFLIANYTALPTVKAQIEKLASSGEDELAQLLESCSLPDVAAADQAPFAPVSQTGNASESSIKIAHLYGDLLNLYGDGGNIRVLCKRLEWRGIPYEVVAPQHGQDIDLSQADLVFVGGGPDREQRLASEDLTRIANGLHAFVDEGGPLLAICGGYQMLGKTWLLDDEEVEGLGIFDACTKRVEGGSKNRLIGNIVLDCKGIADTPVVGFENHAGRTFLEPQAIPFGRVQHGIGKGNNDDDNADGVLCNNAIGTYLHGPLLGKNPQVADYLLNAAIARHARRAGSEPYDLSRLDDSVETEANAAVLKQLR